MMEAFKQHTGKVVPYDMPNVDTDQIIPARVLKKIDRVGFGELLFNDVRYNSDGSPKEDFILNQPSTRAAASWKRTQFGIGLSREHTPGPSSSTSKVVIAPASATSSGTTASRTACFVQLSELDVQTLMRRAGTRRHRITVDLEAQEVHDSKGFSVKFEVDAFRRDCLLRGLDDIGLTLEKASAIDAYEKAYA
jgi:3-isopropylmalate/(R)-2-methylmalate dehydratase small subunit